jgi:hypothetical protein
MDELIHQVITVVTEDFTSVQHAIKNTGKSDSDGISLPSLHNVLMQCANSCLIKDNELNRVRESGKTAVFIPLVSEAQWIDEISKLKESVIIVNGIDERNKTFEDLKSKAWHRFEKVIAGESHRGMAENFTQQYIDMFRAANPRNPKLPSVQERFTTDPEQRYAKFVELVNQRFRMKDIAVALGLSLPAAYLVRKQYRERLETDPNVNQGMPAMKFHQG